MYTLVSDSDPETIAWIHLSLEFIAQCKTVGHIFTVRNEVVKVMFLHL